MEFLPERCGSYGPYIDFSTENATNTVQLWALEKKNDPRFQISKKMMTHLNCSNCHICVFHVSRIQNIACPCFVPQLKCEGESDGESNVESEIESFVESGVKSKIETQIESTIHNIPNFPECPKCIDIPKHLKSPRHQAF